MFALIYFNYGIDVCCSFERQTIQLHHNILKKYSSLKNQKNKEATLYNSYAKLNFLRTI